MPKFKKGDKVRVRLDCSSVNRGRIGTIDEGPKQDTMGFWYIVKLEIRDFMGSYPFAEQNLESVDGSEAILR